MKYTVIGWTSFDNPAYPSLSTADRDENYTVRNALIRHIRENKLVFGGMYHQEGEAGVPVFNDGKALRTTQRSWGEIMAQAWGDMLQAQNANAGRGGKTRATKKDDRFLYLSFAFCEGNMAGLEDKFPEAGVDETLLAGDDADFEIDDCPFEPMSEEEMIEDYKRTLARANQIAKELGLKTVTYSPELDDFVESAGENGDV